MRAVVGWTAPTGTRSTGTVTSTRSVARVRSSSAAATSASRAARASWTWPRAAPILAPASLRAAGGRAPISRLASAIGDFSPECAMRAALSSASVPAAAMAASASSTMTCTDSALSGVTCTGS